MNPHLIASIQNAAGRNRELLTILSQTDYAPPALQQNTTYISDLQTQIQKTEAEIKRLHRITEDERKDHVKYEDSTFKRYMYKMGGRKSEAKFVAKAEKEEREFVEAWQKEREAQDSHAEMSRALEAAQTEQPRLQTEAARHDQAQTELDQLYTSIFSGPTPEIPYEDDLEQSLESHKQWSTTCTQQANLDRRATEALDLTLKALNQASRDMADALDMSRWDMFGGGTFTDMMERDALSRAQISITQSLRHMDEAQRNQPCLPPLQAINIDHGHFVSDVLFDNIFTDMAQHDRIKASDQQVRSAVMQCRELLEGQRRRAREAEEISREAGRRTYAARFELQKVRSEAFERFAVEVPPPPY